MESPRRRPHDRSIATLAAAGLALAGLMFGARVPLVHAQVPGGYWPSPAIPQTQVWVSSGPYGVTIYIQTSATTPGYPGSPGGVSYYAPPPPRCFSFAMSIGNATAYWIYIGLLQHPGTLPWFVVCTNGWSGVVWVPTSGGTPRIVVIAPQPAINPSVVAAQLVATIPIPPISIGANPGTGLVALPSWFWVAGYSGQPLYGARTLGGTTVYVMISPARYQWTFGDGGSLVTTSPGHAYPWPSDIQHNYQRSSLSAGGIYWVSLQVTFTAWYRVNGGSWLPLQSILRSYNRAYWVQQLQSVLTGS